MRKLMFMAALVFLAFAAKVKAVEPVSVIPWLPESSYDIAQSTISVSSTTVTTISAVSGYRQVHLSNLVNSGTTIYYRIDGSTQNISTVGWPIEPRAADHTIESNAAINLQLAAGASSVTVTAKTKRK